MLLRQITDGGDKIKIKKIFLPKPTSFSPYFSGRLKDNTNPKLASSWYCPGVDLSPFFC
jgi:hypothetical protein